MNIMVTFFIKHFGRFRGKRISTFDVMDTKEKIIVSGYIPLQILIIKLVSYIYTVCDLPIVQPVKEYVPQNSVMGFLYALLNVASDFVMGIDRLIIMVAEELFKDNAGYVDFTKAILMVVSILVAKDLAYLFATHYFFLGIFTFFTLFYNTFSIAFGLFRSESWVVLILSFVISKLVLMPMDNIITEYSKSDWKDEMILSVERDEDEVQVKHGLNLRLK